MQINETDQQRQKRLVIAFPSLQGSDQVERIQEKEADANRILHKMEAQIDSLINNTSLIALDNVDLLELYVKIANFAATIDVEVLKRQ